MQYNVCPYCGANLDPGERCDCQDCEEGERKGKDGKKCDHIHAGSSSCVQS